MTSVYDDGRDPLQIDHGSIQLIGYDHGNNRKTTFALLHFYRHDVVGFNLFYSGDLNADIFNHPERVEVFTRDRERFRLLGVEGNPAGTLKLCFERYYVGGDDE